MLVRSVDDKPSDTLVVVSDEGFWTGSSTLPHLHHHLVAKTPRSVRGQWNWRRVPNPKCLRQQDDERHRHDLELRSWMGPRISRMIRSRATAVDTQRLGPPRATRPGMPSLDACSGCRRYLRRSWQI